MKSKTQTRVALRALHTACCAIALAVSLGSIADRSAFAASQHDQSKPTADQNKSAEKEITPQERMAKRYPQPVRAGDLVGLPVLDYDDSTIGWVRQVVRTPAGIVLVMDYGGWLTFKRRPIPVPIETVAILGRQIDALDLTAEDFDKTPTWSPQSGVEIPRDEMIQIAIGRR